MNAITDAVPVLQDYPALVTLLQVAGLFLAVWLTDRITQSILVRTIERAMQAAPASWARTLIAHGVISRLAHVVPAIVVYYGIGLVSNLPPGLVIVIRGLANAYAVLTIALSLASALSAANDIYQQLDPERARARPIKGYLQVVAMIVYMVAAILIVATLFNQNPLILLSGLGAMTAVLLLIFKDTLLSLVASVLLSTHDMLRVGDWIEMPQLNADGYAIDVSLHTVKVQNWDRTITTIPTWRLISESYKNWRGMFDSGGRQIKRAIYLDQATVRFLTGDERDRLRRFALLVPYLDRKSADIEAFNRELLAQGKDPVNTRRVTNVGTFRAYVDAYLRAHPRIHKEMFLLVRQLQPQPNGLPLEIYCYTTTTAWAEYEGIQADIFDHLYAILPEFGLRVFQQPSGADVAQALASRSGGGELAAI